MKREGRLGVARLKSTWKDLSLEVGGWGMSCGSIERGYVKSKKKRFLLRFC